MLNRLVCAGKLFLGLSEITNLCLSSMFQLLIVNHYLAEMPAVLATQDGAVPGLGLVNYIEANQ